MDIRRLVDSVTHPFGVHVSRYTGLGSHADTDLATLLETCVRPIMLDIGANTGQTIRKMKSAIPACHIHAFEPSPAIFLQLKANTHGIADLTLVNAGVGETDGEQTLLESNHSDMSSFLTPSQDAWGETVKESRVQMVTLDSYCRDNRIESIDLLKIDTQGYDLQVLRGARDLLSQRRIRLVKLEVIFSDMYEGAPSLDEIYKFMLDHHFRLLGFYNLSIEDGSASWADAIFVSAQNQDIA